MKILAIDTTSRIINIALSDNGKFFSIENDLNTGEYEDVLLLIKKILKKSNVDIKNIDYFGVCNGPGSFTGIRIGLSAIKALAYSLNKPVVVYKSLDLSAWMVKDKFSGLLCVAHDARRNNIYSTVYTNNNGLKMIMPYLLSGIDDLLSNLKRINKKLLPVYFYGDIVSHYKDKINNSLDDYKIIPDHDSGLKSKAMISLIESNKLDRVNSFKVVPFYMYPKDCQVNKQAK